MPADIGSATLRERILGSSAGYRCFKVLTRGDHTMAAMAAEYVEPQEGERILDVGCGYGDLAHHLPGTTYVGIDTNKRYIDFAQDHATSGASYAVGDATQLAVEAYGEFDCAVLIGVLHHLSDDQATAALRGIAGVLRPSGRLVAAEPVWDAGQRTTARVLAALDRGMHVREQRRYEELVSPFFPKVTSEIRHDLFWFPYTHCMIQATLQG